MADFSFPSRRKLFEITAARWVRSICNHFNNPHEGPSESVRAELRYFSRVGLQLARNHLCLRHAGEANLGAWRCFERTASLYRPELAVVALQHSKASNAVSHAQYPAPGVLDHAPRH